MSTIKEKLFELKKFRTHFEDLEIKPYFFKDGTRKIYYVIVLYDQMVMKTEVQNELFNFFRIFENHGLEFEIDLGILDSTLVYIKIHAPENVLKLYADLYDLDVENAGHNFIATESPGFNFRETALTRYNGDVFKRMGNVTSCERIVLLHKIFSDPLDSDEYVNGLDSFVEMKYIYDAFPLHDGNWHWLDESQTELNDRQLLAKFWANFHMWYKRQPINLIAKYFGSDLGFYFAWVQFYIYMLIYVAIVGVLLTAVNLIILFMYTPASVSETCSLKNISLCPLNRETKFTPLTNYCVTKAAEFVLGNYINMLYAIFIAIWSTCFLIMWKRKENTLSVRWNVENSDIEYKIRPAYRAKSKIKKKSEVTGTFDPYITPGVYILRYIFIYIIIFLVCLLVMSNVFFLVYFKVLLIKFLNFQEPKSTLCSTVICAILQVIFIKIFSNFYIPLSIWLSHIQIPKTQKAFDDAVIYKIYIFSFINNFVPIFYTAFLRGRFFTIPGQKKILNIISKDHCLPTGCIIPLTIQLILVMSLKSFGGNLGSAFIRKIRGFQQERKEFKKVAETHMYIPTWEKEYYLKKCDEDVVSLEFSEMIIQLGYVSFFLAACPLIGLVALVNNIFELRSDALKITKNYRRPVPSMSRNIGAWNKIIKFTTYASIILNGFLVAFNTDFIPQIVYRALYQSGSSGYMNFQLSKFDINDSKDMMKADLNGKICYYPGYRNPPDDPVAKYTLTRDFYVVGIWRFAFLLIFENLMFMFIAIMHFKINFMPRYIREQLHAQKLLAKEIETRLNQEKLQQKDKDNTSETLSVEY